MSRFCLPRDIYHGKGCLEEETFTTEKDVWKS